MLEKQKLFEEKIVSLVNSAREKAGLSPLALDPRLSRAAREKAKDMAVNRYFNHISPTLGSPVDMIKSYKIIFRSAGENIASGYLTPKMVFKGWMKSPGHRVNILSPAYSHIGVGYYYTPSGIFHHYWVQEFTRL